MNAHDFWYKTILIADDRESYMKLAYKAGFDQDAIEKISNNCVIVTHEKQIGDKIKLVMADFPRVPTTQNPIASYQG